MGRKAQTLATRLFLLLWDNLPDQPRWLFAIDDTPTKRYGPKVQGAGIHHNPTPGPADAKFLYGHLWVTLAWVVRHASWGTIGPPLRAMMYIRQKDTILGRYRRTAHPAKNPHLRQTPVAPCRVMVRLFQKVQVGVKRH